MWKNDSAKKSNKSKILWFLFMKKNYPREYNSWSAMIARCYNPKHKSINIMEEEELQYVFVGEKNFLIS